MPPSKGSVRQNDEAFVDAFRSVRFQQRESGTPYDSAGGGEYYADNSFLGSLYDARNFVQDEHNRTNYSNLLIHGPDKHSRPPLWLEEKQSAIDGTPLSDLERKNPMLWSNRYRKELDVAEAVQEVKRQRRFEVENDVMGFIGRVRRFIGISKPLDESAAVRTVQAHHKLEEEARWLQQQQQQEEQQTETGKGGKGKTTSSSSPSSSSSSLPHASSVPAAAEQDAADHSIGELPRAESPLLAELQRRALENSGAAAAAAHTKRQLGFLSAPWQALVESVETGRPLAKVASEYRPRVDFYGLDPFLDATPSFVWFCTKCGIAIGLVQGTAKAAQAVNVDVQFLKASGVGVLSILNMSVFSSVVKWSGNTTLFALAFCLGDRLMKRVKQYTLPAHDANYRSTSNYVMGLAFSGATVGVLPWWVLNDVGLAVRMAASGVVVGSSLGLMVGLSIQQLIALNTSRLDASNRQLRRYEALMRRQREWAEQERERYTSTSFVWW